MQQHLHLCSSWVILWTVPDRPTQTDSILKTKLQQESAHFLRECAAWRVHFYLLHKSSHWSWQTERHKREFLCFHHRLRSFHYFSFCSVTSVAASGTDPGFRILVTGIQLWNQVPNPEARIILLRHLKLLIPGFWPWDWDVKNQTSDSEAVNPTSTPKYSLWQILLTNAWLWERQSRGWGWSWEGQPWIPLCIHHWLCNMQTGNVTEDYYPGSLPLISSSRCCIPDRLFPFASSNCCHMLLVVYIHILCCVCFPAPFSYQCEFLFHVDKATSGSSGQVVMQNLISKKGILRPRVLQQCQLRTVCCILANFSCPPYPFIWVRLGLGLLGILQIRCWIWERNAFYYQWNLWFL